MKKMIAILVLACTFSVATANTNTKANAFVQPFDQSYAMVSTYIWYTDAEYTNPTGSYCDIWYEINFLRSIYPEVSFSHVHYAGLTEFEFGYAAPWYYATIYSDLTN